MASSLVKGAYPVARVHVHGVVAAVVLGDGGVDGMRVTVVGDLALVGQQHLAVVMLRSTWKQREAERRLSE